MLIPLLTHSEWIPDGSASPFPSPSPQLVLSFSGFPSTARIRWLLKLTVFAVDSEKHTNSTTMYQSFALAITTGAFTGEDAGCQVLGAPIYTFELARVSVGNDKLDQSYAKVNREGNQHKLSRHQNVGVLFQVRDMQEG